MTRSWPSKLLGALVLIAIAGAIAYPRLRPKAGDGNLGSVTRGDLIQRVTIAGSVSPNRKTVISAPYNGYVRQIFVQVGDHVKEGDPVVSLAQSLRGNEDVYPMRAPFSGTVVQVLRTEGEYLDTTSGSQTNGTSMVRIDDLTRIFVEADSPEIDIEKLKVGQDAIIKASAVLNRTYHGKIEHISLAAKDQKDWDKSRVEFPVLIEVKDPDGEIKPGMSVIVDITTRKVPNVLMLRHEYIQRDGSQYYVTLADGSRKPIQVGIQNEDVFEIKSGLAQGDKVRETDFLSIAKSN